MSYVLTSILVQFILPCMVVTGSYTVHLPDGRIQTVTYTADHYNGYVADVKYEGTAVYPEAKPYKPAPAAYKPAPPKYNA